MVLLEVAVAVAIVLVAWLAVGVGVVVAIVVMVRLVLGVMVRLGVVVAIVLVLGGGMPRMTKGREERERRRIEALKERARQHNAKLFPETPGYVRIDGPRRQYRAEVINGELHYTEI